MPLQDDLPAALRALRTKARLSQGDLRDRGGPPLSTVSKLEAGVRPPDFRTVAAYLEALGLDLHDLADALAEQRGERPNRGSGRPRPEWVGVIRDSNFEVAMFRGLAFAGYSGSSEDLDRVEADLVASAEQVARERALAGAKFRRDYESEVALEVAEGPPALPAPLRPRRGKS